ncbi:MAG TPA: GDSL-type esterase/lipase family protein [Polyangia bacterium]|jgi:lysophospholipase L1-like esterase|nr:GDSL-type esterase/lipase family protein [Polyangia bacterium]
MRNLALLAIGVTSLAAACSSKSASNADGGPTGPTCPTPFDGSATLAVTHSNPLISVGAPAFASPNANAAAAVTNGVYHNGGWNGGSPTADAPSWIALQLTAGPTRVLFSWDDGGTYDYDYYTAITPRPQTVYGLPTEYHIDVSADSTDGSDGTWKTVVPTVENQVRTRAHSFDFTGMSWVKMVITNSPGGMPDAGVAEPGGVVIGQIDVHDLSATGSCLPDDTWFFMGDSITAFAYDRGPTHQPSFAAAINAALPNYFPAMINGGIGSEKSGDGLARLQNALDWNPDYRFFLLGYGTNDAANGQIAVETFQSNMQMMVDMTRAAGKVPIIPHIPYSGDGQHGDIPQYNAAIDTLTTQNGLLAGPDFYSYFMTNASTAFTCGCSGGRMTDNLHPNEAGLQEMNTLWATQMQPLYH